MTLLELITGKPTVKETIAGILTIGEMWKRGAYRDAAQMDDILNQKVEEPNRKALPLSQDSS